MISKYHVIYKCESFVLLETNFLVIPEVGEIITIPATQGRYQGTTLPRKYKVIDRKYYYDTEHKNILVELKEIKELINNYE